MYRKTWMEVNLDQIAENVKNIKEICKKRFIAVLKADAYGCGDIQVCKACMEGGADMVALSSLDEAIILRNEGYDGEILILGTVDPADVAVLVEKNITTAAFSLEWIHEIIKHDIHGLRIHMAIDTGMNRIGFRNEEESFQALQILLENGAIVNGIFTHFFCSDEKDHIKTNRQFDRFKKIVSSLNYEFEWVHCDNSDATIFHHDDFSNACRVGITLYGISPYIETLHHPISLYTTAYMCKKVSASETIGYGATYTTSKEEIIVTAPIGYADGLIRANQGRKVYVDGCYAEIVGRVCMDQIMIRVDHDIPLGTPIEIFGSHISLESMAKELNTIPYEIICLMTGRVTRKYIWHNEEVVEQNDRLIRSRR